MKAVNKKTVQPKLGKWYNLTRKAFDKLPIKQQNAYVQQWLKELTHWPSSVVLGTAQLVDSDLIYPKKVHLVTSSTYSDSGAPQFRAKYKLIKPLRGTHSAKALRNKLRMELGSYN